MGHKECIQNSGGQTFLKSIHLEEPEGKREDNIRMDLREIHYVKGMRIKLDYQGRDDGGNKHL
jgi:hypothetical protein